MSNSETLTSEYAAELIQRQDVLQAEAGMVLEDLELIKRQKKHEYPFCGSKMYGIAYLLTETRSIV